ncbi:MAG: DNA mismatch repair endonuclease MutL [Clostridia bacterium]|nr:DNA mismatch repair endonuclease MutL [Clostridia bacterium]
MGVINILGFDVANLIAAGEVVDRPASVVKELLENALDAGATAVTVEIQNGGISFIRVSDNGCGMDAEDLPVAVLRHATSKIASAEDLDGISTLGFRGEALAAISSVSKVRIFSKVPGAEFGALLECDGGSVVSVTETGCAPGTTVIVEELFFNVPARRKFLKKDSTETVAVTGVVEKIALSTPDVSIKYIADGEVRFMTAGDGNLKNTVYALFGRDTASRTVAVDRSEGGIRVHGFVSEPDNVRSNRNMENFFINGRYVKSRTAAAALEQAFASRIPAEKFPFCVLNIELNPAAVDVNVHPAKLEVKFSNEKIIFEAVYYAVLGALESASARPQLSLGREKKPEAPPVPPAKMPSSPAKPSRSENIGSSSRPPEANPKNFWVSEEEARKMFGAFVPRTGERPPNTVRSQVKISAPGSVAAAPSQNRPSAESETTTREKSDILPKKPTETPVKTVSAPSIPAPAQPPDPTATVPAPAQNEAREIPAEEPEAAAHAIPDYVIVGEAFNCYVIVQLEDRLLLIDKHAAHERILFDQLCENLHSRQKTAQVLMFPLEVNMTEAEVHALEEYREKIEAIGFGYRMQGTKVLISEIPTEISRDSAPEMLVTLAGRLAEGTGSVESTEAEFFEARLYQASCKAAIKGGRVYSLENIKWLCDRILCVPENGGSAVKTCPHGRPVAFEIRKNSIERQFSRLV